MAKARKTDAEKQETIERRKLAVQERKAAKALEEANDRILKARAYEKAITPAEADIVTEFLQDHFGPDYDASAELAEGEAEVISQIEFLISSKFSKLKYPLGLGIDFCLLANALSEHNNAICEYSSDDVDIFNIFEVVSSGEDSSTGTLTLKYGSNDPIGIRRFEDLVVLTFDSLLRPTYPSAYGHNTSHWRNFRGMLNLCFRLSKVGWYKATHSLLMFGLANMEVNAAYGRPESRIRLLPTIVEEFRRAYVGENGGMTFQGLAYGVINSDRPHLSLVTDKTRGSSRRQRRVGDIDGYKGLDLEISVEVKDLIVIIENIEDELGAWIRMLKHHDAVKLAFLDDASDEAISELERRGVVVMTRAYVQNLIKTWDWPKQDFAVQGILHFFAHVEQDPVAYRKLLEFIEERDDKHDSLVYLEALRERERVVDGILATEAESSAVEQPTQETPTPTDGDGQQALSL
ncbi:MAG TPA: hypothetical protein VGB53_09395 [Rubricoccaceae bacterium]|jgi:hypothetical protein